jgi:hypothetical protein
MMSSGNRKVLRPLFTGLGAALCIASFFTWDARNSTSLAQDSNRCDGPSVRRDWVERHDEIRRARQALREMIAAVHDKYTDTDFGNDPKTNRATRQKFSDAFDEANRRFEELITGAAYNSTRACHVCQLLGIYEKARQVDDADQLTMQEVERFSDWFDTIAVDRDQIDRIEKRGDRGRLEDARINLRHDMEEYKRRLDEFRHNGDWDSSSPKMAGLRDRYTCERMQP